ncbi:disintegrin and metalloproteinase domain-containing protein 20-like [Crotalus adamanteus]|uniref:Disintegrin and metalloproteinase domain-containing protein 20-like n=1 Tax=Crotalus adamanteus TaxID=8729 RepID=A0AAW1C5L9_CROAD
MNACLSWLIVILLKIIQNAASRQAPPQGFRYASYDVIIPRKLSPKYGQEEPQDVSYLLQIEGNPHVVFLRQRRNFIPKVFPVFTYDIAGILQVDHPFIKDDCFYHGFIQRKSSSRVTLSTCSGGLRGLLQIENKTYEIEPVQESSTFQHVVFRLEVEEGAVRMACGIIQNAACRQAPPQGFRYASYDVIIPRKLSPKYGQEEPQDVSYLLQIEGNPHVVFLRQRRNFIPKVFPVFTYDTAGILQVDHPFIKDDCFYHGFIQRKSSSRVTLSTCSGGLRGLLQIENKTYEIEPVQESSTFQHVVFRLEVEEGAVRMACGVGQEEQGHQEDIIPETEHLANKDVLGKSWWPHTRYVKVAIVIDHE